MCTQKIHNQKHKVYAKIERLKLKTKTCDICARDKICSSWFGGSGKETNALLK